MASKIVSLAAAAEEEDDDSSCDSDSDSRKLLVRYQTKEDHPSAVLSYLTKGITWAPSYSLVLDKANKMVKMEGKATLLCDVNLLKGDVIPEISLVTGQPKMMLKNVNDPLITGEGSQQFLQILNAPGSGEYPSQVRRENYRAANMKCSVRIQEQAFGGFGSSAVEDAEGVTGGEAIEDFFHYNLKNVPVEHGHPISMDFINKVESINYEDIYFVDLNKAEDTRYLCFKLFKSFLQLLVWRVTHKQTDRHGGLYI